MEFGVTFHRAIMALAVMKISLITNVVHSAGSNTARAKSGAEPPDRNSGPEEASSKPPDLHNSWFSRPSEAFSSIRRTGNSFADRTALRFLMSRSKREKSRFKDWVEAVGLSAWAIAGLLALSRLVHLPYFRIDSSGIHIAKADVGVQTTSDVDPNYVPPLLREAVPAVMELTLKIFADMVSRRPTFVLFYAPWCPYCKAFQPTWDELAILSSKHGSKVQLAQVDSSVFTKLADKYSVKGFPTLIIFNKGRPVQRYTGPRDLDSLHEFIRMKQHAFAPS